MTEREVLAAKVANLRQGAMSAFSLGVEAMIFEIRRFASAAEKAIGEISIDEAFEGVGRVVAERVAQLTGKPTSSVSRETPGGTDESPILAFQAWVARYVVAFGRLLTQDEYALAQSAFFAAHPGQGPTSALMGAPGGTGATDEASFLTDVITQGMALTALVETLEKIRAHATAACERDGFGIEDTNDLISIRELADAALLRDPETATPTKE